MSKVSNDLNQGVSWLLGWRVPCRCELACQIFHTGYHALIQGVWRVQCIAKWSQIYATGHLRRSPGSICGPFLLMPWGLMNWQAAERGHSQSPQIRRHQQAQTRLQAHTHCLDYCKPVFFTHTAWTHAAIPYCAKPSSFDLVASRPPPRSMRRAP